MALKTSPKKIERKTRPTQKVIMMNVGTRLSEAESGPM
jgi:hypothetical protein